MSLLDNFIKHKFLDSWVNLKSNVTNYFWARKFKGEERIIVPPSEYRVVFEDDFKQPLNTEKWRYAMPWGDFHGGYLHQYYDTDGTLSYVSPEGLILELRRIPKTWKKSDLPEWRQTSDIPDVLTIPVGVGFVSTKQYWRYGWFEASIKLPKGQSYWNAFWMSGEYTWPPEIDIFEAYSHEGPEYQSNKFKHRRIKPNLHYRLVKNNSQKMYGSFNNTVAEATKRFVQYVCHWEENFIKIYYDGKLVLQCTDPKILDWFNKPNSHHFLILNHGLHADHPESPDESAMIVRNVKIYQK